MSLACAPQFCLTQCENSFRSKAVSSTHRQEYATIAGMIVTQYGRPVGMLPRNDLDDRGSQVSSALDQLRGYYGLGSPTTSGSGHDYFRGAQQPLCSM